MFNAPTPDLSCERREASTIAPQAFTLLNGRESRGRALALADRLLRETNTPEAALHDAFQRVYGRFPEPEEQAACLRHWRAMTERHRTGVPPRPALPAEVVRDAVEENTGEKFRFREPLFSVPEFVPDLDPADVTPETRGLMEVCLVLFNSNEFLHLD